MGAGLPRLEQEILSGEAISFFHRCDRLTLGELSDEESATGLATPIRDNGGEIPEGTLSKAVEYIGGYPYKLQMLGHSLWELATAEGCNIQEEHLEHSKRVVDNELERHVYGIIWKLISTPSRRFLGALIDEGGTSYLPDIQKLMRAPMSTVEECRNELALHGLVEHTDGEWVGVSNAIPVPVLKNYLTKERTPQYLPASTRGSSPSTAIPRYSQATADEMNMVPEELVAALDSEGEQRQLCGLWMPRSHAYCVLAEYHKGRCRSRTS